MGTVKRIALVGPNGVGKSTLGGFLSDYFNLTVVSTGSILRQPDLFPGVCDIIQDYNVDSGRLLSDEKAQHVVEMALRHYKNGWILDGFPRSLPQLNYMLDTFKPDVIVVLDADKDTCRKRISGRAQLNPRGDDDVFDLRFKIYETTTYPVVKFLLDTPPQGVTILKVDGEMIDAPANVIASNLVMSMLSSPSSHQGDS